MVRECEWCGTITEVESTSVVEMYCVDCHEVNIEESEKAIKAIYQRLNVEG